MAGFDTNKVNTDKQDTGTGTGAAYTAIESGNKNGQGTASKDEQDQRRRHFLTQGRKGCRMSRVNISVTPDNLDYLHTMAGLRGESMSLVVNALLDTARENDKAYKSAKRLINKSRKGGETDGR